METRDPHANIGRCCSWKLSAPGLARSRSRVFFEGSAFNPERPDPLGVNPLKRMLKNYGAMLLFIISVCVSQYDPD